MKCFVCLFVNHVKTTERINMGARTYDAKSFVDGHRLLFFGFHIPFPILFSINFHLHFFPPIKTKDTHITVGMETYVVICSLF